MTFLSRSDSIEKLNMSPRVNNALISEKIYTIEDLLSTSMEEISKIRNLGKKSLNEIEEVISSISIGEKEERKKFMKFKGIYYIDPEIKDLGLSVRACNCLLNAKIEYFSTLRWKTRAQLEAIENMGTKTLEEVLEKIKQVELIPAEKYLNNIRKENIANELAEILFDNDESKLRKIFLEKIISMLDDEKISDFEQEIPNEFIGKIKRTNLFKKIIKNKILKILSDSIYGVSEEDLYNSIPNEFRSRSSFERIMLSLFKENKISYFNDRYEYKYLNINEYIESIKDNKERLILSERMNGRTLNDIGERLSITRERVRQLEKRYKKYIPRVYEDKYSYIFEEYDISENDFILGFKEKKETYAYLNMKYKKGHSKIEEMLEDEEIPDYMKEAAERIIYKNYMLIDGKRVKQSKLELTKFVLKNYAISEIKYDEFKKKYDEILREQGLEYDEKMVLGGRAHEGTLTNSNYVLSKTNRRLRYYNINSYDYTDFFEEINLKQYKNIEISTLKIFRDHKELMREYDIKDEYELHNLLKKICTGDEFKSITFNRMPCIEFGQADRDQQVIDLLMELAPISNEELAKEYEEEYGLRSQTVLANNFKVIEKYLYNGTYKVDIPAFTKEEEKKMKKELKDDFYMISDVKEIYRSIFPKGDMKLLNSYNIKKIGYKIYSNYIIKNKYSSASDYFRMLLTSDEVVDTTKFKDGVTSIINYLSQLHKLKAEYEIVEYKPNKYINISRLNKLGINKENLWDYCKSIEQNIGEEFFTIHYLMKNGFEHKIDKLGFDDYFYSSILTESRDKFSYIRIGRNKLFKKTSEKITSVDFIEWILSSLEKSSIEIYDLVDLLENEYGIFVDEYKIIELISESSVYYDRYTKKVYANYDVYFDEI